MSGRNYPNFIRSMKAAPYSKKFTSVAGIFIVFMTVWSILSDGVLKSSQNYQEEEQRYHTVQKGDNLFQISAKNGITIQQLKEINGIGPNEAIFPGQKLKLE